MQRMCLIVTVAAIAFTGRVGGQTPPDFTGTWTLSSTGSYPPDQRLTITQDGAALTIESTGYHVRAATDGTRSTFSETPFPSRVTYLLDGAEHPSRLVANPPQVPVRPPAVLVMTSAIEESVSKAIWAGRQLVLMTYEKERITAPSRTPAVALVRRTIRQALSLAVDDTLVWDTLIVADPLPWGREPSAPTPFRRTFKRG